MHDGNSDVAKDSLIQEQNREIQKLTEDLRQTKARNTILEMQTRAFAKTKINGYIEDLGEAAQNAIDEDGFRQMLRVNVWRADVTESFCSAVVSISYGQSDFTAETPDPKRKRKSAMADVKYGVLHSVFAELGGIDDEVLEALGI